METRTRNDPRLRVERIDLNERTTLAGTRTRILSIEVEMLETECIFHRIGRSWISLIGSTE